MPQAISNLPIGAKVKDAGTTYFGQPIIWLVGAKGHAGYPEDSVTLVSERVIKIMAFDAAELTNPNASRKTGGNGRYSKSNMRQWLNKAGLPWYEPQHDYDAPPIRANHSDGFNPYDDVAAFMSDTFSALMKAALMDTALTVAIPTVDGGGSETVTDKVFLLSKAEIGLGAEGGVNEGSLLPLFNANNSSRVCRPTAASISNSDFTYPTLSTELGWYWWVRSPVADSANVAWFIDPSGVANNQSYGGGANNDGAGMRPALNLRASSAFVSDTAGADGAYTIVEWRFPPKIDGQDADLGIIYTPPSISFTITNPDEGAAVEAEVTLNGNAVQQITPVALGQPYTYAMTEQEFNGLQNGQHTIKVTATDNHGASAARVVTFTRVSVVDFEIAPIPTDEMAKRVLIHLRCLADPANVQIKVCNNANDAAPTWEIAKQGQVYEFSNAIKTADDWAIGVRAVIAPSESVPLVFCRGLYVV